MTSEIRSNSITSRAVMSTVTMTDSGPMFSGITTFVDNSGFNLGTGSSIFTPASNTLTFGTNSKERVRVDSNGRLLLGTVRTYGTGPYYDDICINNSDGSGSAGGAGIDLISKSDNYGAIVFSNESQHERGYIKFEHASGVNKLRFGTLGTDRWQIYSGGNLQPAADSAYDIGSNAVRVRNGYFDTLYGDGSNLTGITGTTINNNADNRIITGSGTANTLNGEANLTFDGAELDVNNSGGSARLYLISGNSADSSIYFGRQNDGDTGGIRYEHTNNSLQFMGYNNSESLRIDSSGRVLIGTDTPGNSTADDLTIANSTNAGITLRGATNGECNIFFGDGTSGAEQYRGMVRYYHNDDVLAFHASGSEKLRLTTSHSSSTNAIMGFGTVPQSSQYSGYDIIQFGETGSLFSNNTSADTNITSIANNLWLDATASSWKYLKTDEASRYQQDSGAHRFYSIASGSAGANCSPKQLAAFENNATNLASLAYGNRPSYKGQLVLFGQSYETEHGGLEFHSSGGGGGGYGARITCYSDGALRVLNRSNSSAWTKTFRMLPTGSFEYGDAPASNLWLATDANGAHYRRSEGSHQFANKSSNGYSVLYCNKNTGSGQNDTRYIAFYWNGSQIGYIYYNSGVINYYTGSDHRLKENITDVADGISIVKQLKPKNFNFINDENKTTHSGFLAHEVQEVLPSLVNGVKDEVVTQESVDAGTQPEDSKAGDPIYQGLDYGKFTPILTKALQELITKVETLEQENIALPASVTNLEGN